MSGDGTTHQGTCDAVISSDSLSRLYGYPPCAVGEHRQRWFMPG
ncbi:Iron(III) dicitrate transport ATP-binding protein fecE [Candidatus Accumulibacter phosphatis]|uniref:Iron(III) dicitrate transport ATP-binding protein fecE n=1 Tax=Candidatus Accumulibacter phosphatis TaxID=327160 RepID=A0A5S4EIR0_9PROT|nr:Iron(III) dicitrate transport ATP-binding protein fecE [Candidatus Accumulibacter phosphatis]